MPKKTINAKEILADIKAGMSNVALMEKHGLSEKGLQSLFKILIDAGVLKHREPGKERMRKMEGGRPIFKWSPGQDEETEVGQEIKYDDIQEYDRIVVAFIYSLPIAERPDAPNYKGTWQSVQLWATSKSTPPRIVCKAAATTDTRNGLELKAAFLHYTSAQGLQSGGRVRLQALYQRRRNTALRDVGIPSPEDRPTYLKPNVIINSPRSLRTLYTTQKITVTSSPTEPKLWPIKTLNGFCTTPVAGPVPDKDPYNSW